MMVVVFDTVQIVTCICLMNRSGWILFIVIPASEDLLLKIRESRKSVKVNFFHP